MGRWCADPARFFDLPRGFRYRSFRSFGEAMDDGYAVPGQFRRNGLLSARRTARRAGPQPRAQARRSAKCGPTARHRPRSSAGCGPSRISARDKDGRCFPAAPRPSSTICARAEARAAVSQPRRHRGQLRRRRDAVGKLAELRGIVLDGKDVAKAHGWVFEVPARQRGLVQAAAADRHGPLPPRGGGGRSPHRDHLSDRGPRRWAVLPLPPGRPPAPCAPAAGCRRWRSSAAAAPTRATGRRRWFAAGAPASRRSWIDLPRRGSPARRPAQSRRAARRCGLRARRGHLPRPRRNVFHRTSGGAAKHGQIMRYLPAAPEGGRGGQQPGSLSCFVESRDASRARLWRQSDGRAVGRPDRLRGPDRRQDQPPQGHHARRVESTRSPGSTADTELAGACFSPDGRTMFVNAYSPGRTLAITGPWQRLGRS